MHTQDIATIFSNLGSSQQGLSSIEADKRSLTQGLNIIRERRQTSLIVRFFAQFTDLMVVILIIAAGIALFLGARTDAIVILFIVILNAIIGFVQEYKAEKAIQELKKLVSPHARIIRDGVEQEIDAEKLVVGDIIILEAGNRVPADARLFEAFSLEAGESVLTGESSPVSKDTKPISHKNTAISTQINKLFMGTDIVMGMGRAVVIAIGMDTAFGRLAHLAQVTEQDSSPLQKELFRIGKFVAKVTLVISVILIVIAVLRGTTILESLIFAASVAVAAVPEGLPATITIALALGVQKLARKKAIIKQLSSVETLGSTTVICTDKTGTLTKNEMTVTTLILPGADIKRDEYSFSGVGYQPKGYIVFNNKKLSKRELPDQFLETLKIGSFCNDAKFIIDRKRGSNCKYKIIGDPTEGALLVAAKKAGINIHEVDGKYPRLITFPFESDLKRMTTVHQTKTEGLMAYTKGAPEAILGLCTYAYINGKRVRLDKKLEKDILTQNEKLAGRALRVLAFAKRELSSFDPDKHYRKDIEKSLTFIGLVGMTDPPRPEVKQAIEIAREAGIRVIMVTGDHGTTAKAIAEQLNLVQSKSIRIVTGDELNKMSDKELLDTLQYDGTEVVFARVDPEHKLKIVSALKDMNEVVAVTGDGVNDAPALKRADIGIAMGIAGTDVSKATANMVLADDSFASIVSAIEEGRTVYNNLRKFVSYIFSCNIGELVTVFAAVVFNFPLPLTAILILLVNLGTDVLPALALGVDPVEPGIMAEPPRDQKKPMMSRNFVAHFVFLGCFIGIIVVGMFIATLVHGGWSFGQTLTSTSPLYLKASTSAFVLLVLVQMANAFNARSGNRSIFKTGIFSNIHLLGAVAISIIFTVAIIELEPIQRFIHTTALSLQEWALLILISLSILVIEEIRKLAVKWIREER